MASILRIHRNGITADVDVTDWAEARAVDLAKEFELDGWMIEWI